MADISRELVYNHTGAIIDALRPAIEQAVRQTAENILEGTRARAPVKTGRLRDSYHVEETGDLEVCVVTDVPYAPYMELGTSRMAPRPHLYPAAEAAKPDFIAMLNAIFGK